MCGFFEVDDREVGVHFIPEDELTVEDDKSFLKLRFKNCTGNIIDLSENDNEVIKVGEDEAKVALSIDYRFKNQRRRTIAQAIEMVIRQRTIS